MTRQKGKLDVLFNCAAIDFDALEGNSLDKRERLNLLRKQFRENFNDAIYRNAACEWYQTAFCGCFVFMYDLSFYDQIEGRYRVDEVVEDGKAEFGGYDYVILWQSYPRLGLDDRNQFDYYRDMPGGIAGLKRVVKRFHEHGIRVFLNYNPWDTGTRRESKPEAEVLAELLKELQADGLFLDTMFIMMQLDAGFLVPIRQMNPGIVFDTEGVPNPKQAELVSGSWQQRGMGLNKPTVFYLTRFLEPRYSMRGICRESDNRTPHVSENFFHGCGHLVWENIFGWWNPWDAQDRNLFKKCVKLLRDHKDAFRDPDWQPCVETLAEGVYAHRWRAGEKVVYTLWNAGDKEVKGPMIKTPHVEGWRYYDVWGGGKIAVKAQAGADILSFALAANSPGCIVGVSSSAPVPNVAPVPLSSETQYRRRVTVAALRPHPVAATPPAKKEDIIPGMVFISGGRFVMNVRHNSWLSMEGACYGDVSNLFAKNHPPQYFWMEPYFIDIAEVTNEKYAGFLKATQYQPSELTNFLKLWDRPSGSETQPWEWRCPQGKENHPVVWVDLDDARAYATWAGKRLPREEEWQYAAQGAELTLAAPFPTGQLEIFGENFTPAEKACWSRERSGSAQYRFWPWGNTFDPSLCNGDSDDTTPVDRYPQGASLFGCLDMVGNVWEWTESERDDGHTRYAVIRGGSHRVIRGSRWYAASGAQPCDVHEKIPLMYPGLDRCSNIGFRCVKDIA